MNNEPKIGLVTVLYNGVEVLEGFFESLAKQTYKNYILYVIDNSPNEIALNEAKRLAEYYNIPSEFIYNNANLGVAKGNNQGIELSLNAGCEYVLLLNNDVEFENNLLEKLFLSLIDNQVSMVIPKMYYFDEPTKLWCAGGFFLPQRGWNTRHYGENEIDNGKYDSQQLVDYAPTCCMLIKSDVFEKIGLMDEKYFVYSDDADFCYRAKQKNIKLMYSPITKLWHKVSSSTGGNLSEFSLFYMSRNLVYFNKKYFPLFKFYSYIFFQLKFILKFILGRLTFKQVLISEKGFINGTKL